MFRIITVGLGLLSISLLLGSSIMTLFNGNPETLSSNTSTSEANLQRTDSPLGSSASGRDYSSGLTQGSTGPGIVTSIAALPSSSVAVEVAIRSEVDNKFRAFIDSVAMDSEHRLQLTEAFTKNYTELAKIAANEDSSSSALQDANYVVNQMAAYLSSDELAELETFLEDSARQGYEEKWLPQLDSLSSGLSSDNKQQILETLFSETYATTNPNGTDVAANAQEFLNKQLQAIENARLTLKTTLTQAQFELANQFLVEQEMGLHSAAVIFGSND